MRDSGPGIRDPGFDEGFGIRDPGFDKGFGIRDGDEGSRISDEGFGIRTGEGSRIALALPSFVHCASVEEG